MAKPLKYDVPKPDWTVTKTADDEMREFVELLHQRGVLRLANTLLGSLPKVSSLVMEGLYNRSGSNAVQNISALVQLVANMPPEQFRRICLGITEGLQAAQQTRPNERDMEAPGLKGAVKLLHNDELWRDLAPLIKAARSFSEAMQQSTDDGPHAGPGATER